MRFQNWLTVSFCLTLFWLPPLGARAAEIATTLQQAAGSSQPIYKIPAAAITSAVQVCASRDPLHAGDYVVLVLKSGRNDADAIAPGLVGAAIHGLGAETSNALIGAIVHDAVGAAPTEVLDIVTAAVKASPRSAAPTIVRAATSAVPHPDQVITVNFQRRLERIASDGKDSDYKSGDKQLATEHRQETIAEAIVQAALDADPSLSPGTLTASVDTILGPQQPAPPSIPVVVLAPVIPVPPAVSP